MASYLRPRHNYIARAVADAFALPLDDVQIAVKKFASTIDEVLSGASSSSHIFAYYQQDANKKENNNGSTTSRTPVTPPSDKPELIFSTGNNDSLKGKAAYFVRTTDKPVDLDKLNDGALLFGEVDADVLSSLSACLGDAFQKHVAERTEWGKTDASTRDELKAELARVSKSLEDTIAACTDGLLLSLPPPNLNLEEALLSTIPRAKSKKATIDVGMVSQLQNLLKVWCGEIEAYVAAGGASHTGNVDAAAGPRGILEYWTARNARLSSVTEQLRRKDVRTVVTVLTAVAKGPPERVPGALFALLRRWKEVDLSVTEAANEAKDNVKYLATLSRYTDPLYGSDLTAINDALPALLNGIKMVYSVARYFNTGDRMTDLLVKVTAAVIGACRSHILNAGPADGSGAGSSSSSNASLALWKMEPEALIRRLRACIHTASVYQETFALTKERLAANPKGKQFDFPAGVVFGKLDLFCRRAGKLAELFSTLVGFRALAGERLEGMGPLMDAFNKLATDFTARRHDLLAFLSNDFDRDYVEFCAGMDALDVRCAAFVAASLDISAGGGGGGGGVRGAAGEGGSSSSGGGGGAATAAAVSAPPSASMQSSRRELGSTSGAVAGGASASTRTGAAPSAACGAGGNAGSSSSAPSAAGLPGAAPAVVRPGAIASALDLLEKYRRVLTRPALRADLEAKAGDIFSSFGGELDAVAAQYEEEKHAPPRPRNLPPVAGNISWARNLLDRIEAPMNRFGRLYPSVFSSKDGRRVVRAYNRVARTLVQYEVVWTTAWAESIDTARAGLSAPLIVRHPEDGKLYVNFDAEVLQLIAESKALARLGTAIPPPAGAVLAQEARFKRIHNELTHALREFSRITKAIIPVTAALLAPAVRDVEARLRPGMISLTWTSINVETFRAHVEAGLARLEELVRAVNDVIENRIEKNLRAVSRVSLITTPPDRAFGLDEFVALQQAHVSEQAVVLSSKNEEVERAVGDLLILVRAYALDASVEPVTEGACRRLAEHYNYFMYTALLTSTKNSLRQLKKRIVGVRGAVTGAAASGAATPHLQSTEGSSSSSGGNSATAALVTSPLFELDVQLTPPTVRVSPSLEDVQVAINRCANAVLSCSAQVLDWAGAFDGAGTTIVPRADRPPYFIRITRDIEIVRVVLLLAGSIQSARVEVGEFLLSFEALKWLWADDGDAAYRAFVKRGPSIDDYERELTRFSLVDDQIGGVVAARSVGALSLSTASLKAQLRALNSGWRLQYTDNLHRTAAAALAGLTDYFKSTLAKLNRPPDSLDSIKYLMDVLSEVREREACIEAEMLPVADMYTLLETHAWGAAGASGATGGSSHHSSHGSTATSPSGSAPGASAASNGTLGTGAPSDGNASLSKEEMDNRAMLRVNWMKLRDKAEAVGDTIAGLQAGFRTRLLSDVKTFRLDVMSFREDFLRTGPGVKGLPPDVAQERLRRFEDETAIRQRKRELYTNGEDLFGMPSTEYPELDATVKEIALLAKLYGLYKDVMGRMAEWRTILWADVVANIGSMTGEMDAFASRCRKMPKRLRDWDAYAALKKQIEDFQLVLPLLQELSKPSVAPRHWEAVEKLTGTPLPVGDAEFKLSQLLAAPLVDKHEEITEVTDGADKEQAIGRKLDEVEERWATARFTVSSWKARGVPILMGVGGVVEELEEAQMNLQTLLTMRYVAVFRERASSKLKELSDTGETLELWQKVQLMWCSLESVFTGGDIAKQMPVVAKKFQKVDKDFSNLMARAAEQAVVTVACSNELLRLSLPAMYEELERCQKSLEGYLEQKRNKFPRFYFVSNPVLLQILSQGSDPLAVQAYYEKIFDSISCVEHDKRDKYSITAMVSREGRAEERIAFRKPVKVAGNIEDWLMDVLREMQRTMKMRCEEAAGEVALASSDLSALRRFVDGSCGQYSLLGIQLMWTADCEDALSASKRDKSAIKVANKKALDVLSTLSSWCLSDLGSKMNRTKIETLVTIQVHQRDVINDIAALHRAKKIAGPDDFEWLKQARFYWDPEGADALGDNGACRVRITDVSFDYQYEYLGCKERLVITPLTDRCYITLAQAMGMFFGGAPAGPAGTGKTETVKDMGRTLGIFVVVTNCTDQMRYTDCGKIFKGLCMAGLWGCFDEFNRITLPVLSVVAQQVLAVNNAKKAGVPTFVFPGDPQLVTLDPVCGFFITMNPGYAGRQELPENLKVLFRGVTMMVPDREIIMKVKLCSVGYTDFNALARKFFVCYQLAEQQLSKQKHYDFGLRNILSVLRTAGATKRENIDANEEMLLYRTLRDMNLSKLIAQDVPLFLSMLADLFPSHASPPKREYPTVEAAIRTVVAEAGLVFHPSWITKIVQLHETCLVRHGIMLTGPAGGGKSKILETLQAALTIAEGRPVKVVRMNPKAVQAHELYGQTDPLSGEWVKGVFASIWEKYNNRELPYTTWLVQDGPVDAIWIEDLNTVLDDNKLLTLASGDRIPMTDNVKIMFENESLANASPATVSRAGIIYISDTDLDWTPVAEAWVSTRPTEQRPLLKSLFTKLVGDNAGGEPGHAFDYLVRHTSPVIATSRVGVVSGLYSLLGVLLDRCAGALEAASAGTPRYAMHIERLFVFATAWALGGLLEPEDRARFDNYLRKTASPDALPPKGAAGGDTVFEYTLHEGTLEWSKWRPPAWKYPGGERLDFSNLLVPTLDSARAMFLIEALHTGGKRPVLLTGGPGTAKTSTALMFFATFDAGARLVKRLNFSSATTPGMFQESVEGELDKRGGKSFGPPGGKKMTLFIDDVSMPLVNNWGDQPTNEIVRQLVEQGGMYFLDKDKRGDFKVCEDLSFVAAMTHPGGGRNDIPNRLKRHFFVFNMVLPSLASIDDLYGQMLRGRFAPGDFTPPCVELAGKLTGATIDLWRRVKSKMLPTPAKFHYVFNMRELSRVFQGVLLTPSDTIKTGGLQVPAPQEPATNLLRLWKHECARVFADKLTTEVDKAWYADAMEDVCETAFGAPAAASVKPESYFVDFFREDVYDEDEVLVDLAPKIYEDGGSLENVRARVVRFMTRHNEEFPARKLELVLFRDALQHLVRIARILAMPRGCALLVGVGGSGKRSLTRLAAYIARSKLFQIALTKSYNVNSLKDDLRVVLEAAGRQRRSVTFLMTDAEIKDEAFLEYVNSLLLTGEVGGLFAKDEMMAMCADLQPVFLRERPGMPDSPDNLRQFFTDCVRNNLHIVLCMSPVNAKFPERARKFPGIINGSTIDWFLPWPEEALVSVSRGFLSDFPMEAEPAVREALIAHMGAVHGMVVAVCEAYYAVSRRRVYQTPKSFLSFLSNFKTLYAAKLDEAQRKETNVNRGLEKLIHGAADVEAMKIVLAAEGVKLAKATEDTNKLLASLTVRQAEAETESAKVAVIKANCEAEAARIAKEKHGCEADLAKAQPIVERAVRAVDSIKAADINEVKKLAKPADIIRVIFDTVIVLFQKPLGPPVVSEVNIKKRSFEFIEPSYSVAQGIMGDGFLKNLQTFNKDAVNEETVELMKPYTDLDEFDPVVAKAASNAAEGLCTWCRAMGDYYYASKIVRPKLEALAVAQAKLAAAEHALATAVAKEEEVMGVLSALRRDFEAQVAEKSRIEDGAAVLQRKMEQASALINGLGGERARWGEDSRTFADMKRRLLGDCAVACAFISYCGPFNQPFRTRLITERFTADCRSRGVPVSPDLDVTSFLVDVGTVGNWGLQGLPTDPLSIQNGILVTRSERYPLLVDPQGQALAWLRAAEADRLPKDAVTSLSSPKLKDALEFAMSEGRALIIVGVEEELDPLLDPVLEKAFITKGRRKYVRLADTEVEVHDDFTLYFISRLPNPHFSPELQAKTTVVDFTVTQKGLEEQLLGRVIGREQSTLEKLLHTVLAEVNANTKALLDLDAQLLDRLSSNAGNLLDDEQLVDVLASTKAKAAEVKEKLTAADETKVSIREKREQFRPVATRGSVLYFAIVEMASVNVMYQTSLAQFIELFSKSMEIAERAALASKRVANIIDAQTYLVYRYVNKGLYERDKLLFVFIVAVKILVTAGALDAAEVGLFLRGGAALDIAAVGRKKPSWLSNEAWLNVIALSDGVPFFKSLPEAVARNEASWRRWYEDNEPETCPVPDLEGSLRDNKETGPWRRLLLLRALRVDRTLLGVRAFVRATEGMGERYVAPVTDTIESLVEDSSAGTPIVFLLSIGADPTDGIEQLAKRRKTTVACVSMGEGQEPVAVKAINASAMNGSWVLLQNCELGLELMEKLEDMMAKLKEGGATHADFRLFITALPHPKFPLGLLQMATKVTNEPPAGLRAGLLRSYSTIVDQDRLERIDAPAWRQLVFGLCWLHSVAQERRKFGPLGWAIPYEYATNDLAACLMFLEKHMYAAGGGGGDGGSGGGALASALSSSISWPTVQYMVAEVQYGGKVTDDMDRVLLNTLANAWVAPRVLEPSFTYNPTAPITRIPGDFKYACLDAPDVEAYRRFVGGFPEVDTPELFGLHPNADLTFRVAEASSLLNTMADTQPRQAASSSGAVVKSLDDVVLEKAGELLSKLPPDYVEEEFRVQIKKLGGLSEPLNIFLFQEVQRLQAVIARVRAQLGQMQAAIRGEVVMTSELLTAMNDLFDAKVPRTWLFTPGGDEFSWLLPTLGLWYASLLERDAQLRSWLTVGRPAAFWMSGFANPQGFLTAMKQEVTRQRKGQYWALDDVVYHAEVTDMDRVEQATRAGPPKEGVYIYGLFVEGARWDKANGTFAESEPKRLYASLPILHVTVLTNKMAAERRAAQGPSYDCPVYRYPNRTGRYLVFNAALPSKQHSQEHWTMRGAAILCTV